MAMHVFFLIISGYLRTFFPPPSLFGLQAACGRLLMDRQFFSVLLEINLDVFGMGIGLGYYGGQFSVANV